MLSGCSHSRSVRSSDDVAALDRRVEGRRVAVVLADGRHQPADGLRIEGDSLSWIDPASRLVGRAATADLRGVLVGGARVRGVAEGTLLGAASGAVVGAGVGSLSGDCFLGCITTNPRAEAARFWGIVFGIPGAGVGATMGLVRGSPTLYRFSSN